MKPANAKDQIDRLEEQLFKAGQVSRNYALYQMGIYRLGARIFDLKKRGWVFFPGEDRDGDFIYRVRSTPGMKQLTLL